MHFGSVAHHHRADSRSGFDKTSSLSERMALLTVSRLTLEHIRKGILYRQLVTNRSSAREDLGFQRVLNLLVERSSHGLSSDCAYKPSRATHFRRSPIWKSILQAVIPTAESVSGRISREGQVRWGDLCAGSEETKSEDLLQNLLELHKTLQASLLSLDCSSGVR